MGGVDRPSGLGHHTYVVRGDARCAYSVREILHLGARAAIARREATRLAETPYDVSEAQIRRELLSNHSHVRGEFLDHFKAEIDELGAALYQAIARLRKFGERVGAKPDLRGAWVEAFLFSALNNVLSSGQLFIAGFPQPAGNLMRAYGESAAMALLLSLPETRVLQRLERDLNKFPVHQALELVERKHNREALKRLGLGRKAWSDFKRITKWYDSYSHPSVFAITGMRKFAKPRAVILGSGFDEAKVAKVYPPELHRRISAAEHLPEFIHVTEEEVLRVRALQKG